MNHTTAFSNVGTVRIAPYDAAIPFASRAFFDTGNTDQLDFTVEEEVVELADARELGGTDATMRRVRSLTGTLKLRHISREMFEKFLYAVTSTVAATPITNEAHKATKSRFVPTNHIIDQTETVSVKKGATALDAADWSVEENGAGIIFADTFATVGLVDGDNITVDYTPVAQYDVEALVTSAPVVSIICSGTNGYTDKACRDWIYKARLGAVQGFSRLHGGQFGEITINFSAEKDATIAGANASKFYKHTEEI